MGEKVIKSSGFSGGLNLPLVEEFYSIQGEGFHAGKAAYFIRLGGCDIGCSWCDSPESWNQKLFPLVKTDDIITRVVSSGTDSVVVTGGEPLMFNLNILCSGLKRYDICIFLETSGAYSLSGKWDWICLSPKLQMPPLVELYDKADELKVIIEQESDLEWAEKNRRLVKGGCRLFLQPEWSRFEAVIPMIVDYIKKNPAWRVSLQIHKYMNIP